MLDPTILIVAPQDYAIVADIYNTYIELGQSTMVEKLYTTESIADWVENLSDREVMYVMKVTGEVIGWGIIKKYSDRAGYRFAGETSIFISQSRLRQGYGTLMKRHLIQEAKRLDYHHLVARIFASNVSSIQYNQELGYTIVGRQNQIGYKNGKWQDIVIMQYLLEG